MTSRIECATKGIITKDGKFLAIKISYNGKTYLDLPGGRIEYGLSPEENVVKEVKEEVFLDVKVQKLIGTYHFFRVSDNRQTVCIVFLCKPISDKVDIHQNPDINENITEYIWVTPEEFMKLDSEYYDGLDRLKKLVRDYFQLN